jgi:hypothetical protein
MFIFVQSSYLAISVPGFSCGAAGKKQKINFFEILQKRKGNLYRISEPIKRI